ncbi:uncharacterized protein [Euwallacea fornicatus]|uniref:uncharacterized protein n=1 Tax=Euwallacea fornicatus TaxID=995702 RepID=UPI00338D3EF7
MQEKYVAVSVLIGVLFGVVNCHPITDQRALVIDFHRECLDAHGVLEDVLHDALDGTTPEEHDFYLHLFCAAKKGKLINDDGIVNTDNIEKDLKDVILEENMATVAALIRKCLVQREDILTTIKEGAQCFFKQQHKL